VGVYLEEIKKGTGRKAQGSREIIKYNLASVDNDSLRMQPDELFKIEKKGIRNHEP
jgi:hypothetical protein